MGIESGTTMSSALNLLQQGVGIVSDRMARDTRQDALQAQAEETAFASRRQAGEERRAARREAAGLRERRQRDRARKKAALGTSGTSLTGSAMNALAASAAQDMEDADEILTDGRKRADDALGLGRYQTARLRKKAGYAGMQADRRMVDSFIKMGGRMFSSD